MSRRPWRVRYSRQAAKDLGRLDPPIRERVVAAIDRLAAGDAVGVIRLRGSKGDYRLRVGDWRVILRRLDGELVICLGDAHTIGEPRPRGDRLVGCAASHYSALTKTSSSTQPAKQFQDIELAGNT